MNDLTIQEKTKTVTLEMNMDLYDYESVLYAAKEFGENFWVALEGDPKKRVSVHLTPKPEVADEADLREVGLEFYNYTLGLMQQVTTQ